MGTFHYLSVSFFIFFCLFPTQPATETSTESKKATQKNVFKKRKDRAIFTEQITKTANDRGK